MKKKVKKRVKIKPESPARLTDKGVLQLAMSLAALEENLISIKQKLEWILTLLDRELRIALSQKQ